MREEIFTRKENYRQYRRGWKNDRWILPLFLFLRYIFIYIDFAQLRDSFDKKRGGCSDANPREICPKCSGLDRIIRTRSIKINGGLTGKLSRVHQGNACGNDRREITHNDHRKAVKSSHDHDKHKLSNQVHQKVYLCVLGICIWICCMKLFMI